MRRTRITFTWIRANGCLVADEPHAESPVRLGGLSQAQVVTSLEALSKQHPEIAAAWGRTGTPLTRQSPRGFPTLLSAIVGQQISVKAAAAIRGRLWALMSDEPSAEALARLSWQDLRDAGLSARKIEYAQGLAEAILSGALPLQALEDLDDEGATKALVQLKGFGPWTAKIYLLFSEGRPDIYPPADLALEKGLQILLDLPEKPTTREAEALVVKYSPHRGSLCFLLWALYGAATLDD